MYLRAGDGVHDLDHWGTAFKVNRNQRGGREGGDE